MHFMNVNIQEHTRYRSQDLVSEHGNMWMSVVVPGARNPPYTIKMQLRNYIEYMATCHSEFVCVCVRCVRVCFVCL
jgi:hypothetical protein